MQLRGCDLSLLVRNWLPDTGLKGLAVLREISNEDASVFPSRGLLRM